MVGGRRDVKRGLDNTYESMVVEFGIKVRTNNWNE
jgi:hypothetical protein